MPIPKSKSAIESQYANTVAYHKAVGLPVPALRKIDMVEGHRVRPMRVLCLGYSRTGTVSLLAALRELGYHPYHMVEAVNSASMDFPLWEEALRAKFYGEGKPWGREEFDKMLGQFDGCEDVPCILFAEELINMYPEAKVILTHRPVEDWIKSVRRILGTIMTWPFARWTWADPTMVGPWFSFLGVVMPCTNWGGLEHDKMRKSYEDHYALVRRVCPKERLLEMPLGKSGWNELCEFLGHKVPTTPWPKLNESDVFVRWHWQFYTRARWLAIKKIGCGIGATFAVGMIFYCRNLLRV